MLPKVVLIFGRKRADCVAIYPTLPRFDPTTSGKYGYMQSRKSGYSCSFDLPIVAETAVLMFPVHSRAGGQVQTLAPLEHDIASDRPSQALPILWSVVRHNQWNY